MQWRETTGCRELGVSELSDAELLANTRGLIGRSNQVLAALLAHLGEVEARGLHRQRACSSLYAYCIYELRLSEDEAVRRVSAARLVRRFPELLDAIAAGELRLTGLLLLGPHLTRENFSDVMARAEHRTKKELTKLVRILDPLPDVPARIEVLGSARPGAPTRPTWAEQVASFCPVRELTPGDRPRAWVAGDELPAPARPEEAVEVKEPLRFKVQFTATDEYVNPLERAAALLSNRGAQNSIEEIQLRALRGLVENLEKRRYGATPRARAADSASTPSESESETEPETERERATRSTRRSRHIPARVRRAVFDRDGARCTHIDSSGQR